MTGTDASLADGLRQAMRGLASSVALLTACGRDGSRHAMTATSVTSLSLEPPAMLACVNRSASLHPVLAEGGAFGINILSAAQLPLARLCSGGARGEARFADGAWLRDASGVPYLADAQAAILCTQERRIAYGTHDILIGKVHGVFLAGHIDPLLYADGGYARLHREAPGA